MATFGRTPSRAPSPPPPRIRRGFIPLRLYCSTGFETGNHKPSGSGVHRQRGSRLQRLPSRWTWWLRRTRAISPPSPLGPARERLPRPSRRRLRGLLWGAPTPSPFGPSREAPTRRAWVLRASAMVPIRRSPAPTSRSPTPSRRRHHSLLVITGNETDVAATSSYVFGDDLTVAKNSGPNTSTPPRRRTPWTSRRRTSPLTTPRPPTPRER